jgi:hemerythrin-like domain-containing protein
MGPGWEASMTSTIQTLREEHRNIRRLLDVLDDQIEKIAMARDPNYDLLQAVANYFCDYPDRCHHPKEDAVFRQLQARHPVEANAVGDLAREHKDAYARVRRFRNNIQAIFRDEVMPRDTVVNAGRSFVDAERAHMKMEEDIFFPAAVSVLDEEDWRAIEANLKAMRDPLFGEMVEEEFRILRDFLLTWEKSDSRN